MFVLFSSEEIFSLNQRIRSGFGTPSIMLQVKVTLSPSITGRRGPDRLTFGRTWRENKKHHWFYASYGLKITHKDLSSKWRIHLGLWILIPVSFLFVKFWAVESITLLTFFLAFYIFLSLAAFSIYRARQAGGVVKAFIFLAFFSFIFFLRGQIHNQRLPLSSTPALLKFFLIFVVMFLDHNVTILRCI